MSATRTPISELSVFRDKPITVEEWLFIAEARWRIALDPEMRQFWLNVYARAFGYDGNAIVDATLDGNGTLRTKVYPMKPASHEQF